MPIPLDARAITTVGLAAAAAALSVASGALEAPALLLAVAAVVGAGGLLALAAALTAVFLAATPIGQPLADPSVIAAVALSGAGLGLALRATTQAARRAGPDATLYVALGVAALAALAAGLPDDVAVLLGADGRAASWTLAAQDARTGLTSSVVVPASIDLLPPLAFLGDALPVLIALAGLVLLFAHAARHATALRVGYLALAAAGALLVAFGLAGLAQLLGGAPDAAPDVALALDRLHRAAGGQLALTAGPLPEGTLGLASRPGVDPLRVVLGLGLALAAYRGLRPAAPAARPAPATALPALVTVALLVAAAGALFAATQSLATAYALLAGAVLMAVGLFSALTSGRPAGWAAWAAAGLAVTAAWLAPWAGWAGWTLSGIAG